MVAKDGEVSVAGRHVDDPASSRGPLLQLGARAGATLRVAGRVDVSADREVLALPILWSVALDDATVWTSPRVPGTVGLDAGFRFE